MSIDRVRTNVAQHCDCDDVGDVLKRVIIIAILHASACGSGGSDCDPEVPFRIQGQPITQQNANELQLSLKVSTLADQCDAVCAILAAQPPLSIAATTISSCTLTLPSTNAGMEVAGSITCAGIYNMCSSGE